MADTRQENRESEPLLRTARRNDEETGRSNEDSDGGVLVNLKSWLAANKKPLIAALITVVVLTLGIVLIVYFTRQRHGHKGDKPHHHVDPVAQLVSKVEVDDIFAHLKAFEKIANEHPSGSRSIANAYNASADYVTSIILAAQIPCKPHKQYFDAPVFTQHKAGQLSATFSSTGASADLARLRYNPTPAALDSIVTEEKITVSYQEDVDFRSMRYGGQAAQLKHATVVPVLNDGCDQEDYPEIAAFDVDNKSVGRKRKASVALIEAGDRGGCSFFEAAYMAEVKGYSAVIFYNDAHRKGLLRNRVRLVEWKSGDPLMTIPVISVTYALGSILRDFAGSWDSKVTLDLRTFTSIDVHRTFNVLCEIDGNGSQKADDDGSEETPEKTIVVGAHLDSVPAGPGMVDNASGSSTILAILLAMKKIGFWGKRKVIFAWWGAEEVGLLGSRHYVRELAKESRVREIGLALNFDMLGSPNYTPQIHLGSTAPEGVQKQSTAIQKMFEESFNNNGLDFTYGDMYGGSDFLPFLNAGVPAGGVLTGAGERKTPEERSQFGGFANAPLDPCYHQSCDTVENVSREAINITSRAAAYGIATVLNVPDLSIFLNPPDSS